MQNLNTQTYVLTLDEITWGELNELSITNKLIEIDYKNGLVYFTK